MFKKTIVIAVAAALGGCATEQVAVDHTPQNPTVALQAKYTINGYLVPDGTGQQTVYTRADKRRITSETKFDSWISRKMFGGGPQDDIARLDRNLMWTLVHPEKKYLECPLQGCRYNILSELGERTRSEDASDEAKYEPPSCSTTTTRSEFTVTATGQTRVLNGFSVAQYKVKWLMLSHDELNRPSEQTMLVDLWSTEPTATMEETWRVNEAFQQSYLQQIGAMDNPLSLFVSQEIYMALAGVFGDIEADKKWGTDFGKELNKLKGYPISIKTEWYARGNACEEQKEIEKRDSGFDITDPAGAIGKMAGGFLKRKAEQKLKRDESAPLIRYVYEVTDVAIAPQQDSVFEIPMGYEISDRN